MNNGPGRVNGHNHSLQSELQAKCGALFTDEREQDPVAEENLYVFLSSSLNFKQLNFFDPLPEGFHQGALPMALIALIASMGKQRCLGLVFDRLDIQKINFNNECKGAIFVRGTTLLHLIAFATLNACTPDIESEIGFKCLTSIFKTKELLKKLNFNAEINQGYYIGTTVFWLLSMIALRRSRREFLDNLLKYPDIRKKINFNIACQRGLLDYTLRTMLNQLSFSTPLTQSVPLPQEQDEPHAGMSIGHIFAELAIKGSPDYLRSYLQRESPNAGTLNQRILGGPNRGASLFIK